ncbi:hydrogenase maturation nickel metallochaperone HypA [Spectribacter hydrogenoxidans]|uniref:Hydrogenase maturation factor HypA n=1 Tax=Spectribacter hydrogenoxidans TaxID=3075608 RepID=A0ABU3C414_9GAMM|nr:hydrogenase maturation nickel metallochaperone HypA [Salinisphaera sp. W335]MDT0636290.1 hydrogenase maturation nickel metallochaperone HypA [Salinisphaera sp. W335]
MHELAVTSNIVNACSERAGRARVLRVTVHVGALSCVAADAMRFCFDVVAAGTPLEGAALDIIRIPAHSRCRDCGAQVQMNDILGLCGCGSSNLEPPRGGEELTVKSMEIEEAA